MDSLVRRHALSVVREAMADTPLVVIQGARQVGKSTLAHMATTEVDARFVTLDDPATLDLAIDDPRALVAQHRSGTLIIDEAQRAPGLILPLKAEIDSVRRPGRFILTGSADLLQVKGVGDSLAGRAETVNLAPFSVGELSGRSEPEDFLGWLRAGRLDGTFTALDPAMVIRGGYPEATARTEARARRWLTEYAARLATHDARELAGRGYADHLLRLLQYIAAAGQSELVKASLARHLDVAESTVDGYLRVMRAMHLVVELPGWSRSSLRRVVKRSKFGLLDTGLSSALSGLNLEAARAPGGREHYGSLVEQFVAVELTKQQNWSSDPCSLFHLRDADGFEVDLVAETTDGQVLAIEIKATTTPTSTHARNLVRLRERLPDRQVTGVLLHAGEGEVVTRHGWLHQIPITALWEHP